MFPYKSFKSHIKEMRGLGEILMAYTHPKVKPIDEDDVLVLKSREVIVDGYSVVLFYSKSDWDDYCLETLQVLGKNSPFLPFGLVVKIAKMFLGGTHLSLVEIFKEGRKIYCWSVNKKGNVSIPGPYKDKVKDCVYEGFVYKSMSPDQVNFY